MAWKFVAEDGDLEVNVPNGLTVIGRGSLLQISDKHVSRQHAEIEVENGKCRIRSTHSNPCFHKPRDDTSFRALEHNEWNAVQDGDSIALAPNQHRFKLAWSEAKVVAETTDNKDDDDDGGKPEAVAVAEATTTDAQTSEKPKVEVEKLASGDEGLLLSSTVSETAAPAAQPPPGYAANEAATADDDAKRMPCQYGGSCYKKNPIHFKEYCHPGDVDYPQNDVNPPPPPPPPTGVQSKPLKQQQQRRAPPKAKAAPRRTSSGRPMREAAAKRVKTSVLEAGDSDEFNFSDEADFSESSESEEEFVPRGSDDDWMPGGADDDEDDYRDEVIDEEDDDDGEFIPGRSNYPRKRTRGGRRR